MKHIRLLIAAVPPLANVAKLIPVKW